MNNGALNERGSYTGRAHIAMQREKSDKYRKIIVYHKHIQRYTAKMSNFAIRVRLRKKVTKKEREDTGDVFPFGFSSRNWYNEVLLPFAPFRTC